MSQEIVKGGPARTEAQELNAPKKVVHRPRLGMADKIALGLTGLGLGSLAGTAIETQNQTPPPQVAPDQRGSVSPPEGVTFPKGVRADAPVEQALPFKVLLPTVTNKAVETLTQEQRVERFIATTQVVDRIEQVRNNKTYIIESRVTPEANHKVVMKEEVKQEFAKLVAQDAERNGFTKAGVVIVKPGDTVPEGVVLRESSLNLGPERPTEYIPLGSFGYQRMDNRLILHYAPNPDLPFDDQFIMGRVNRAVVNFFFRMTISGGDYFANVARNYRENPEYFRLANQGALAILPR